MDPTAELERLYDEHAQALFAFLLDLTRSEADTRDLLQEVLIKIARRPELLDGVCDERHFLLRMARNQAVDLARRRGTRDRHHGELAEESAQLFAPTEDPDRWTFGQALAEALGELPPDQREVMHLKLWEDLTFEEIAAVLEISPNTAASRYRYGLDKLRARLRPLYEELNENETKHETERL